jgi:hypothetical protein
MGAPFPIPLIGSGLFGAVGSTDGRERRDASVQTLNLAVSGADVRSLLVDAANAATVSAIDSETDLVLFPRLGSQMQIVESLSPQYVACWIGNNDALGAVTSFDRQPVLPHLVHLWRRADRGIRLRARSKGDLGRLHRDGVRERDELGCGAHAHGRHRLQQGAATVA